MNPISDTGLNLANVNGNEHFPDESEFHNERKQNDMNENNPQHGTEFSLSSFHLIQTLLLLVSLLFIGIIFFYSPAPLEQKETLIDEHGDTANTSYSDNNTHTKHKPITIASSIHRVAKAAPRETSATTTDEPTHTSTNNTSDPTHHNLTDSQRNTANLSNNSATTINIFALTCTSFPIPCAILNISQLNRWNESICNTLSSHLLRLLYPSEPPNRNIFYNSLFVLSLRREYFLYLYRDMNFTKTLTECELGVIVHIFGTILVHNNSFHPAEPPNRNILYHTHVSKAAGSMFWENLRWIGTSLGWSTEKIQRELLNNLIQPFGGFIFKGAKSINSFKVWKSCDKLYRDSVANKLRTNNGENSRMYPPNKGYNIIRESLEAPESNVKICAQFFNSIIMRQPIDHRLSMLAFQNNFWNKAVGIYCNKSNTLQLCQNSDDFSGFIKELVEAKTSIRARRLRMQRNVGKSYKYLNMNTKKFALGIANHRYFNVDFMFGLLSNLYIRWIGYHHVSDDIILDAMVATHQSIINDKQYLLTNSKRVLIQYDYVLPLDRDKYTTDSYIWKAIGQQIQSDIFHIPNEELRTVPWREYVIDPKKPHSDHSISTHGLRRVFNESNEWKLLEKINRMDLELFDYAKQIASMDQIFYKKIER